MTNGEFTNLVYKVGAHLRTTVEMTDASMTPDHVEALVTTLIGPAVADIKALFDYTLTKADAEAVYRARGEMIQKITNINHTICCHPDAPNTWRHNFDVKLTNLSDDQAVKFWDFIGTLHVDEVELEPGWSAVLTPQTDDDEAGSA